MCITPPQTVSLTLIGMPWEAARALELDVPRAPWTRLVPRALLSPHPPMYPGQAPLAFSLCPLSNSTKIFFGRRFGMEILLSYYLTLSFVILSIHKHGQKRDVFPGLTSHL